MSQMQPGMPQNAMGGMGAMGGNGSIPYGWPRLPLSIP